MPLYGILNATFDVTNVNFGNIIDIFLSKMLKLDMDKANNCANASILLLAFSLYEINP